MFDEHEEVMGEPSFELRLHNGVPQVSGCYFMHPVIQVVDFAWDEDDHTRILVTASDGSKWHASGVSRDKTGNVVLNAID